jgi:tRNA 2-thiouridine synthesizing protein D
MKWRAARLAFLVGSMYRRHCPLNAMRFAIQVNSGPYQAQAPLSAYRFVQAALEKGHEVSRVFFYFDGVDNARRFSSPPDDERSLVKCWSQLAQRHRIDLVVCVSAAQRRGLLSAEEARRDGKMDEDLADGFRISGLGQLVEAALVSDRFLVFGA